MVVLTRGLVVLVTGLMMRLVLAMGAMEVWDSGGAVASAGCLVGGIRGGTGAAGVDATD